MHAMIFHQTGGPEVFEYAEVPTPGPGPGELLIQVACAGVNPADWKNREGMLARFRSYDFPCIIGFDAAGVVAAVGEGVSGFAPGDRVFTPTNHGQGAPGSYAQYTVASVDRVAKIPEALSYRQAAAVPLAALTAWQALFEHADVAAGDRVLVHGGAGAVGSFAVQFARWAGASVAATCSAGNSDYLGALGADCVIDYRAREISAAIASWSPGGLDYVINPVGHSTLPGAMAMLKPGGGLVCIATLVDDRELSDAQGEAARLGVSYAYAFMSDGNCAPTLARIADLIAAGVIHLPPISAHPLREVAAVHEGMQRGQGRGKQVLVVADL